MIPFKQLAALILIALLPGCASGPDGALLDEESVNPGINDSYLDPALDPNQWVERFEREGREVFDHRLAIVEAIGITPGSVVADIGSGTGLFTPLLAKAAGSSGKVYAVDIVPQFLARIKQRAESNNQPTIQTVLCTERSVELGSNKIDFAYICDVYHHFQYPQNSLASIRRALRPGGQILLIDFKRIPGVSTEWMLNHVRAEQEVFTQEIVDAGFELVEEIDLLEDNYFLRFRKR